MCVRQIEHALGRIGFNRLSIHRPGVLLTSRPDSRPLEHVAQVLLPRLHWLLDLFGDYGQRWKAITVETVAQFLVQVGETKVDESTPASTSTYSLESYTSRDIFRPTAYEDWQTIESAGRTGLNEQPDKEWNTMVEIFENEVIRSRKV